MPIAAADFYSNLGGSTIYAGRLSGVQPPVPPPGTVLTTLTMANETIATQPADLISPMFGVSFKRGELPMGDNPQFKLADGTACPASVWGKTTWPDGSLKFCAAMVRIPASVPAGGSLVVQVQNGGVLPAPSARTTADLTGPDIKVELTGITNLSGLWTASLSDAIASATDVTVIGSGAAGKVWRIGGDVKQAGAVHGQLYCWHYVAALTASDGSLLGLRYLGRVAQPWADVATPAPTRRVVTAQLKLGATVRRTFQGHDTSETPGANIGMDHYTSWFTADSNARWDYVQGAGSSAADSVVRVKHDKVKLVRTTLVPPYDTTLTVNSNASTAYRPYANCFVQRAMGGTGERDDLGLMNAWTVRHLLTQAAVDETVVRAQGLISGGWRITALSSSTKNIIPTYEAAPSYAGLGPIQKDWYFYISGDKFSGYVAPASVQSLWSEDYETSHRPSTCYYPYLITGEPQYLDLLIDMAATVLANSPAGTVQMNMTPPITLSNLYLAGTWAGRDAQIGGTIVKGGGWMFQSFGPRAIAWGFRDIVQSAAIYPDVCPRGTETRNYFRGVASATLTAINAYNSALGPAWGSFGAFDFNKYPNFYSVWMVGYMINTMCQASNILPGIGANQFRHFLGQFWEKVATTMDMACAFAPHATMWDENGVRLNRVEDVMFETDTVVSFSAATNRMSMASGKTLWNFTEGDRFCFTDEYSRPNPLPAYPYRTIFYAVNVVGKTTQLSLTAGGPPITVGADVNHPEVFLWANLANAAPYTTFEYTGNSAIMANICGAIRHSVACGETLPNALSASNSKIAGTAYADNPKNAYVASYPA